MSQSEMNDEIDRLIEQRDDARRWAAAWKAYAKHARRAVRQGAEYWVLWQAEKRQPGSTMQARAESAEQEAEAERERVTKLARLLERANEIVGAYRLYAFNRDGIQALCDEIASALAALEPGENLPHSPDQS